jgi:hypothetical protein
VSALPEPVALDPQPGHPAALADLIDTVTGAAFRLGALGAHLSGPAADAPGWLGADAAAAVEQIAAVARLARDQHTGVSEALARLAFHHDLLVTARARVQALRTAQRENLTTAAIRLAAESDPLAQRVVLQDLETQEAGRRAAHAAVLAEVEADAAATAAVLARSTSAVGGGGRRGDAGQVTAYLAGQLPGWGDPELADLGRAAAINALTAPAGAVSAELTRSQSLLGRPAFAVAFLSALGADQFLNLLKAAGLPERPEGLPTQLATLVAAAVTTASDPAADPRLRAVLDVPLRRPPDSAAAVALGRMARSGALPATYLARLVPVLTLAEQADPGLRGDELGVAAGEDPLDDVLGALTGTRDADTAAAILADPALWPQFLGRTWSEGLTGLDGLLRLATYGAAGADVTATVLDAIGGVTRVMVDAVMSGCPETFAVQSLSPAIGHLVAAHLPVVTDTVVVGQSHASAPSRPIDGAEKQLLRGLGMVTLDPIAREAVLRALVDATSAAPPAVGPGAQSPAAYAHGGVFAAMAFGEAQQIRHAFYSAVATAENNETCWSVITAPLGMISLTRFRRAWEALTGVTSFLGPHGVPLGDFLGQPATGAHQAAFSAMAASMPTLVRDGLVPDPDSALDRGLGSAEARSYEWKLRPLQRDAWDEVVNAAQDGYVDVGDALGFLPGSG